MKGKKGSVNCKTGQWNSSNLNNKKKKNEKYWEETDEHLN